MDGDAWTETDVENYKQIDDPALNRFYRVHKLSEAGPEERAQYLMSRYLDLSDEETSQIVKASALHGKSAAMRILEKMVIRDLDGIKVR